LQFSIIQTAATVRDSPTTPILLAGRNPWTSSASEENQQLLQIQNPRLAAEDLWAHATGAPERGGLLLATIEAPKIMQDDFLWLVVAVL
jgi:hypothetical protein